LRALTAREVAQLLNVSRSSIYQLIMHKRIFSVKVGGARRIPRHAVKAFVDRLMASQQ
jgi:excisionase family DNA binding protein